MNQALIPVTIHEILIAVIDTKVPTKKNFRISDTMGKMIRAAAVQLRSVTADSPANIASCERLAMEAVAQGARWIALPEFFNTGVCWNPDIVKAIQREDGEAGTFLKNFSEKHQVVIGGSFLCRLDDGRVRNRYLCFSGGRLVGRHDKDLPTMWENAFYEGGDPGDTGVLGMAGDLRIGAAVCWEYMRTMTAKRLKNRADLILGGSCWWSIPTNFPGFLQNLWEPENRENALSCIQDTARLVGAPVIHGAHCGEFVCPMPGMPMGYHGFFEGNAALIDARGRLVACRTPLQGEGVVVADVEAGAVEANETPPERFWLRKRGFLPAVAWHHQKWLGRRWYKRHVLQENHGR